MSARIPARNVRLKRAYETPSADDGLRVLIDRFWPRGIRKQDAAIDCWLTSVTPSPELRKWFNHDPARWELFQRRYAAELAGRTEALQDLRQLARRGPVTLVYAAHDKSHNHALVLREVLLGHGSGSASSRNPDATKTKRSKTGKVGARRGSAT